MASRADINIEEIKPKFSGRWESLNFDEAFQKPSKFTKLKSKEYGEVGSIPVIDQGEKLISGYVDDNTLTYQGELPIIIFGDHTRIIKYIDFDFAVGADGTKILSPKNEFEPKFIFYYLKSLRIPSLGYSRHYSILRSIPIPVVPENEQKRIVAKLDDLFGHLDVLREKLDRIPELLKNLRQQVHTQAVTGRLTEEWRKGKELHKVENIETHREELKRELALARGRKTYKHKDANKPEPGGRSKGLLNLFDLPDSWQWVSLDQVTFNISDGPHFSPTYVNEGEGKRFVSMRNVSYGKLDFSDCKYVSIEDHKEFIKRGKPEIGDLLYTKGGSTGIPCVIGDDADFSYWVHVALLKPIRQVINSNYLMNALGSNLCYSQSQELTHGVGNQDLGLTRMIFIGFPLPSINEQTEIVKRVESLLSAADKIEAQYQNLKEKIDQLPQAILAKAFKGELVAQDKNDEPAGVLLEQIKGNKSGKGSKKAYKQGERLGMVAEEEKEHNK